MTSPTDPEVLKWRGGIDWHQFFESRNGTPGGVDVLCIGAAGMTARIGELLYLLLTVLRDQLGNLAYRHVVLILPPLIKAEKRDDWMQHLSSSAHRIRGSPLDSGEIAIASKRVQIVRSIDLQCPSVSSVVKGLPPRSFVIVPNAALYRAEGVTPRQGITTRLEEDTCRAVMISNSSAITFHATSKSLMTGRLCTGVSARLKRRTRSRPCPLWLLGLLAERDVPASFASM